MSIITKNFVVEKIINNTTFTDITDFIISLDDFVLQSTGKIATAKITLNSEFGNFITDANGGVTPLLNQFDRIRIGIIGDDGVTIQFKIFEITTDLSQNSLKSSYLFPIELEGRERNLSGIPFGGFFRSSTHKEMTDSILSAHNSQTGTLQPQLVDNSPDIPDFNPNIWDFTQVDNCFDALLVVLNQLNLPVSAGGGGNRYALIFEDSYNTFPTDINLAFMEVRIIIQGTNNSAVTLAQNDSHPIIKIDKIENPSTGTVTIARGRPKTSLQPQNYPLFLSRLEFYRNIRIFNSTIDYPTGSHVSLGANVGGWPQRYVALSDTTAGDAPPSASWAEIDVGDFVGNIQYSRWTIDKATVWQNGFAHPDGAFDPDTLGAISIPDHNLFINDVQGTGDNKIGTYRDWVIFRTNSPHEADLTVAQKAYLFDVQGNGTTFGFYDGFKVLVDPNVGALQGIFAGNDPNGIPYSDNVAIFVVKPNSAIFPANAGTIGPGLAAGDFVVVRETEDFDQTAVYNEAIIYEFNVPFTPSNRIYPGGDRRRGGSGASVDFQWRSIADSFMGNECFHTPISLSNVTGLVASNLSDGEPLDNPSAVPYNQNSGIKIVFGYNQAVETQTERDVWFDMIKVNRSGDGLQNLITALAAGVFNTFATPNYTNMGWWFVWPSPFPFSTVKVISEEVGELYGGNVNTLNDHRYFDLFNIQYTTTGLQGWVHPDSSDLTEITGVEFLFNYDITISGVRVGFTGDVPFSYWAMDKFGTLWKSPKIMYRHLGETQQIKIEFGDLSPVFRGRTPLGIDNVLENIIVGEIEVNETFFKDNVIIQGFQCETPYDEFGRYSPNLWEQIIKPIFFDVFQGGVGTVNFTGIIDAFGFTKTPVAISAPNVLSGERTIIPQFQDFQNIVNVEQLQRFANAQNQIDQWQYRQYTVEQGGINDLELEDPVVLFDPFMINDADSGPNTVLLTTRELHYSVPPDGGLIRKAVLVEVIE